MSLDLCLKQLHVVHIKVFHRMQYTFALVLLRHFPVRHFPVLQIPVTRINHEVGDTWPVRCQTYGHLPSLRASQSFDWYQVLLLGDRDTQV